MQSIAQQTNSCTGMKGWPNKRFVFNLAFLHFALSSPLHCIKSCVPRSGCNLSRSLHFTVLLMQKSNYCWYMTFAALQKWGRTLPTSPVFSCHIEVQFGCVLIKQFIWNCWRKGRMKASTEVAMVDHQEFHLPAWPIRSTWWASQQIFLEEKTTLTRTWFEKGFNWKLSSRLKKVGKSEDA